MPEKDRRDHLQTLERGLDVILAFSGAGPWLTLSELSNATGLTKPTVRRILLTLLHLGYVRGQGSKFALTPKVLGIGYAFLSSLNLTAVAHPFLEALTDRLDLGTALAVIDGAEIVYVDRVQRHPVTPINLAVGTRLPAHATSMGHVLLADLSHEALNRYFAEASLVGLTERTLTTRESIEHRLSLVRVRGWDAVNQELEYGRLSAAAPIRDASGRVVAALSLSCGTTEYSFDELCDTIVPQLLEAARSVSEGMGCNQNAHSPREQCL
ncbi:IclR family transcriptional regulator C-terminal domain-containing protein [Mycolicibacterium sp. YH-1]|uniref:IclR family transcriptional regulator domain-containing protein n=1 Tax=Mycolicibacterium sp. YH-1 TaxID=2908837 RepID=UPI001F4C295F|nr:IclR family transcriptional regulator C-terminal domain-containing protein [Mycolicibacterium sp. YH-1]UNB54551.1 helix-turn-helix domain-containing protein [Mycolicibacterium sp. YH-1]